MAADTSYNLTIEVRQPERTTTLYTPKEARSVTRDEWDGWLQGAPGGGHVLQSYEWGEFKKNLDWRPICLVLERDGEVVGLGQFLAYDTAPVPGVLIYCTKGPWLPWDHEEAVRAFFEGVRDVLPPAKARPPSRSNQKCSSNGRT